MRYWTSSCTDTKIVLWLVALQKTQLSLKAKVKEKIQHFKIILNYVYCLSICIKLCHDEIVQIYKKM